MKRILIGVLAVTCLLLGGNILRQMYGLRRQRVQAVRDACAVVRASGVELDDRMISALEEYPTVYAGARDDAAERAAAEALLGPCEATEPGGGVVQYVGETGRLSFRRGGALELSMAYDGAWSAEALSALLSRAGLEAQGGTLSADGALVFVQTAEDGRAITNARLRCVRSGETLEITGRWLLRPLDESSGSGLPRPELVLALSALGGDAAVRVHGVTPGWELRGDSPRGLELRPVWQLETDAGTVILDTVTRNLRFGD